MKIGLGTVQFGLDYGVSNISGKPTMNEIGDILRDAHNAGIQLLDTAALYGDSESVIGRLRPMSDTYRIVTKTPQFSHKNIDSNDVVVLRDTFMLSLQRLGRENAYGLLIHQADDLLGDNSEYLFEEMLKLKDEGLVSKIGVSIYTPEQLERIISRFSIDLVQVPVNVFDQRLLAGGHLRQMKTQGIEIHARSVFLQGLLLMDVERLPAHFDTVKPVLKEFRNMTSVHGLDPLGACLQFVMGIPEIDIVVCGVNSALELNQILDRTKISTAKIDYTKFRVSDTRIIHPTEWHIIRK